MTADEALDLLAELASERGNAEARTAVDVLDEVVASADMVIDPSADAGTLVARMGALRRALDGQA